MSDPSIDILTQRLAEADLDPQTRDALAADLDYAAEIKRDADPAMQGIKRLLLSGVRREMIAAERNRETRAAAVAAAASATAACRAQSQQACGAGGPVLSRVMSLARVLAPFRWPLALASFSPFAGDLIVKVASLFRGGAA